MSLLDDIQMMGSRMSGLFDDRNPNRREPEIPSGIDVRDVATFVNPNLALIEGAIGGGLTREGIEKYKVAKGTSDLFKLASELSYVAPGERGSQSIGRAFSSIEPMDSSMLAAIVKNNQNRTTPVEPVVRTPTRLEQEQDSLIPESFGFIDNIQMGVAKVGSQFGFKNLESNAALAAREELNRTILSIGADLFSGRPSKFLLEQIQKTIPVSAGEGDDLAFQKYTKIKNTFESQIPQFQKLLEGAKTNKLKSEYSQKLSDLKYMVDRLDVVTGSFQESGYGEKDFYTDPNLFGKEFTGQDLDDLQDYFKGQ
tara:strand:+ start:4364 stop:5296 length:933 start_codon:yes stop_codon:yes gene_type:complete